MSLLRCASADALNRLDGFDAVIDARSESEYALDHLPGAVNWPTLSDRQREEVGTQYKQISAFEARKRGAAMAARNIAAHLERECASLQRTWKPLIYCWRGGQRSGSLALVLSQIGFEVTILDGGYRAFRKALLADLDALPPQLNFWVLCGTTGSGKSRLLAELARQGAQVLDLEGLACHRGSVLGAMAVEQPSQKSFETQLWDKLRRFRADRPIFVESESRTIGRLRVPETLLCRLRASAVVRIEMPVSSRVALLMADYPEHQDKVEGLCDRLDSLREIRGHQVIDHWQSLARGSQWPALVRELLSEHYDPIYLKSMARNFKAYGSGLVLSMEDAEPGSLDRAARELLRRRPTDLGSIPARTSGVDQ